MNDFIFNGVAHGDVATRLLESDFDMRSLRPYRVGGRAYIDRIHNGVVSAVPAMNVATTLRKDDWKILDDAIVKVARPRLKAVGDLRSAGLTFTIPNGMSKTVLETETQSDMNDASISMDGTRDNANDRPEFELTNLPLPIIHKDFHYSARQIAASRNGGSPLDTTSAETAGRKVAEQAEKLLLGVASSYAYGGGTIYGYTNYPGRISYSLTAPTTSGWTGSTLLDDVLAMKQASMNEYHYGPWFLYFSPNWDRYLDNDFKTNSDKSLRNRIAEVSGVDSIQTLDYLTGYQILLVQKTSDVVREVIGAEITTVQWSTIGGLRQHFKVMAILVPQLRDDFNGNTGIVHGS